MGYLPEKYTREYFLKEDEKGNPTDFGAEGVEAFKKGQVRWEDAIILNRINFANKNVFDVGFGRGAALKFAIERGAKKVIGVDFAPIAKQIAEGFLEKYRLWADLYSDDALVFVKDFRKKYPGIKLDIVLMLDFIEHVPRSELKDLFRNLKPLLSKKAIIVINTPIYSVDNDIIKDGLKEEAHDSSDDFERTSGMHCNRYTQKSLAEFMRKLGFTAISGHFFAPSLKVNKYLDGTPFAWKKAFRVGYPITEPIVDEFFEIPQIKTEKKFSFTYLLKKLEVLSPQYIINLFYKYFSRYSGKKLNYDKIKADNTFVHHQYNPTWRKIKAGSLKGRYFYLDSFDGLWQREIFEGIYDKFFFDYLEKFNLKNKVIFDIGAHIGYHSLKFAEMVQAKGKVYAFEPNQANVNRMNTVLNRNKDLQKRIKIFEVAVSNISGKVEFNESDEVDSGQSSGSYVHFAHMPSPESDYKMLGFQRKYVKSTTLDLLRKDLNITDIPAAIKVDIEGAEDLLLEGGKEFIKKYQPIFLCEIHSIYTMFKVVQFFRDLNYSLDLLYRSPDDRCFLAMLPKGYKK